MRAAKPIRRAPLKKQMLGADMNTFIAVELDISSPSLPTVAASAFANPMIKNDGRVPIPPNAYMPTLISIDAPALTITS